MPQLFPDIDLSQYIAGAGGAVQDGMPGLPPGDPVGVMAGLNQSLISLLANFSPGDLGVCVVDDKLQLSLPVPDWSDWSWVEQGDTASIDAGDSTDIALFAVPADERALLYGVNLYRASGDNTWSLLFLTVPPLYSSGTGEYHLVHLSSAATEIYWPRGDQAVRHSAGESPILLEPGTLVELRPSGAGSAASVATYEILLRRRKIVRAMAP